VTEDSDREATYEDGEPIDDDAADDESGAPEHHPILEPADPEDRVDPPENLS